MGGERGGSMEGREGKEGRMTDQDSFDVFPWNHSNTLK